MKIQITNIFGKVLFEYDKKNNTIKDTVIKAIKEGIDLSYANLSCINLSYVNLSGANLNDANLKFANLIGTNLINANLRFADLSDANLRDADLRKADLTFAILRNVAFCDADLSKAHLRNADLSGSDFSDANLSDANFERANLRNTNLRFTDLKNTNFSKACLKNANLEDAKNIPYIPFTCPSEGSFIGWKKIFNYKEDYRGNYIVKLLIPEDAKRSSATTNKCRCDKAKVLEIRNIYNDITVDVITNINMIPCIYKVGEYVYPDSFDENRWNECSKGIHFFMEKEEAIDY